MTIWSIILSNMLVNFYKLVLFEVHAATFVHNYYKRYFFCYVVPLLKCACFPHLLIALFCILIHLWSVCYSFVSFNEYKNYKNVCTCSSYLSWWKVNLTLIIGSSFQCCFMSLTASEEIMKIWQRIMTSS